MLQAQLDTSLIRPTERCPDGKCNVVWSYFVEACHRVRSINPVGDYQVTRDA